MEASSWSASGGVPQSTLVFLFFLFFIFLVSSWPPGNSFISSALRGTVNEMFHKVEAGRPVKKRNPC